MMLGSDPAASSGTGDHYFNWRLSLTADHSLTSALLFLRLADNESEVGPTFDNKPDAPGNASGSFSIASHGSVRRLN